MSCEVEELRLSFIWAETNLALLGKIVPTDAPLHLLARRDSYELLFAKVLQHRATGKNPLQLVIAGAHTPTPELSPPWPKPTAQRFWGRYLDTATLANLPGGQAWRGLVPLRAKLPCFLKPGAWAAAAPVPVEITVLPEAFFYPHGVAFVATVICQVKPVAPPAPTTLLTLFDAVDLAFKIKNDVFDVTWAGGDGLFSTVVWEAGGDELRLEELAVHALSAIRHAAFGAAAGPAAPFIDPFTVCTVVRGRGVDHNKPIDSDVQRALEAVTSWSNSWRGDESLPSLEERKINVLEKKPPLPGHVLYGSAKARVAWLPERFSRPDGAHKCASYHRSLTFVSLQVESLCGLCEITAELLRNNHLVSYGLGACAHQAGGALGRLYGGGGEKKESYRSMSPRAQIEQNKFVADIDLVRMRLGLGKKLV